MNKNKSIKIKSIHITERDKKLLSVIYEYGLLSTEQVRYLFYPSLNRTRKRLRQLWQHCYLSRIDRPTVLGQGTKTRLYRITVKGLKLVGSNERATKSAVRSRTLSPLYAEHQLSINRFRICLELALKKTSGLYLANWFPDRYVKLKTKLPGSPVEKPVTIVPDSYFTLWSGSRSLSYFLEIDKGTSTISKIMNKILVYDRVFSNPKSQTSTVYPGFRVLLVTVATKRADNVLNAIQSLSKRIQRPDIFFVTTEHQFSYTLPDTVLNTIWNHVERDGTLLRDQTFLPLLRRSRHLQVNHQ